MATKSLTSLPVKMFKQSSIFGIYNIIFIIRTNFYKIKLITMIKNYDQSVEVNHNPN